MLWEKMNIPAGKVTGITRSSSGIGVATAKRCVAEGVDIYDTGRRQKELDAALSQIGRNATGARGRRSQAQGPSLRAGRQREGITLIYLRQRVLAQTLAALWPASSSLPAVARATNPPRKR
jgi:NAD(P)-dependent dehydrogenase (short-subunit alcohol dehydrogenase family)